MPSEMTAMVAAAAMVHGRTWERPRHRPRAIAMKAAVNAKLAAVMANRAFTVLVKLNLGAGSDAVYTCDFSYDYVKINGEYTT